MSQSLQAFASIHQLKNTRAWPLPLTNAVSLNKQHGPCSACSLMLQLLLLLLLQEPLLVQLPLHRHQRSPHARSESRPCLRHKLLALLPSTAADTFLESRWDYTACRHAQPRSAGSHKQAGPSCSPVVHACSFICTMYQGQCSLHIEPCGHVNVGPDLLTLLYSNNIRQLCKAWAYRVVPGGQSTQNSSGAWLEGMAW